MHQGMGALTWGLPTKLSTSPPAAIIPEAKVRSTGRADPDVDTNREVALLGYSQIRLERRIAWRDSDILVGDLADYS